MFLGCLDIIFLKMVDFIEILDKQFYVLVSYLDLRS